MSEQQIMAEEMQSPKKVAFANRKYTNEERLKKEEEELEQLLAEQKGEEEKVEEPKEAEPKTAEERSFKKRYGDLRRHQQSKEKEYEDRIKALEQQLTESTKSEIKLPKSDEDIEAWAKQYPDVAGIVETIAIKKAREQAEGLEARVKEIDEMKATATREKAEVELLKLHPDFGEIRDSDDFHEWALNLKSLLHQKTLHVLWVHGMNAVNLSLIHREMRSKSLMYKKCLQSNTKETLTRLWKLFVQATLYTIYLGQLDKKY
jgi:hypothetical protein